MEKILAYIDESGDPRFNEGASPNLEFSAILIKSTEENKIIDQLKTVQNNLGLTEFKSSKIRSEIQRINILESIQDIDFKYISLSIDKSKVYGEWKDYFKSFYKYSQRLLNSELHRLYPNKTITIDRFGTEQYQESLKQYLDKNLQYELFENEVLIGSATNNILIQLSDLIAGTNRKLRNNEFVSTDILENLLYSKELHILFWPENYNRLTIESIANESDRQVADISITYAERYITKNNQNPSCKAKILILEYLLSYVKFINPNKFIYSTEIITWLKENQIIFSEEEFRKEIGSLRDDGVIIAGSRKGLKIPISLAELSEYLSYTSSRYVTMIKRFKETYRTLNASALGNIDLFNSKEFELHKEIFRILDKPS